MADVTPSEGLQYHEPYEHSVERDFSPSQQEKRPISGIKVGSTQIVQMYLLTVAVVSTGGEHLDGQLSLRFGQYHCSQYCTGMFPGLALRFNVAGH